MIVVDSILNKRIWNNQIEQWRRNAVGCRRLPTTTVLEFLGIYIFLYQNEICTNCCRYQLKSFLIFFGKFINYGVVQDIHTIRIKYKCFGGEPIKNRFFWYFSKFSMKHIWNVNVFPTKNYVIVREAVHIKQDFTPSKVFFPTPGSSSSFTKIAEYAGASAKVLRKLRNMREPHFIYTPPIGGHHRQLNK